MSFCIKKKEKEDNIVKNLGVMEEEKLNFIYNQNKNSKDGNNNNMIEGYDRRN